jgi:5,10-methylenetetrahydromethanopterin reductase
MNDIRIGIGVADPGGSDVDDLIGQIEAAEAAGFQNVWLPNIFGFDAMTLAALGGRVTTSIELGTAVVPTHSRHPLYMAQQALSTQAAAGGRFLLGIGPSHQIVIENMLGLSFAKPALHVREYTTVLMELIHTGKTNFEGKTYTVNGGVNVKASPPCPVLLGALGPLMRQVAGTLADGTITWMAGLRTLGETLVPDLRSIASEAGRAAPRIVAGFPIVLTDDADGARAAASKMFALYGTLPSYRAMLDLEGAGQPGDVAIIGDEREIEAAIGRLAAAGVTDFNANIFPYSADGKGPDGRAAAERTYALLSELAKR